MSLTKECNTAAVWMRYEKKKRKKKGKEGKENMLIYPQNP